MTIEIVDFPIEHGGSFYSYVNVYQRLTTLKSWLFECRPGKTNAMQVGVMWSYFAWVRSLNFPHSLWLNPVVSSWGVPPRDSNHWSASLGDFSVFVCYSYVFLGI